MAPRGRPRIDRLDRAKRLIIELLNEQKQAIIHSTVTRGLDPNVRLKPSGMDWLGGIPEHWEVRRAKYAYREVDERSARGQEELLSVSHLSGVTPRSHKNITMFMAESYAGHKLCRPGDLVINTMWAWMGALGVAREIGIVSPSYAVYRPIWSDSFLPAYIDHLLRTRTYVSEYVRRSTGIRTSRLRLYPEEFLTIPIIRPPIEEQHRIVASIDQATEILISTIDRTHRQIDLMREYRTRLIADVVTGELDVRGVELPELDDEEVLEDWDEGTGEEAEEVAETEEIALADV